MVTIMDAARETGVNHMTLRNWIAAAGLKTTRVGHYLMVDPAEVKKLVTQKRGDRAEAVEATFQPAA